MAKNTIYNTDIYVWGLTRAGASYRQSRRLPRASGLRRGLQNRNIPYMPVHGQQITRLIVHWILLNCHSPAAIKPVNVGVLKRVPPSECLRNERIFQVLKQKAK